MSETQDYLEQLIKHPGWTLLLQQAKKDVGGLGYARRIKQAIAKAEAEKTDVAVAVKMVDAATDAVNAILSWPEEELRRLHPVHFGPGEPSMIRGGR